MFPRHALIITAAGSSDRFNSAYGTHVKKEFITMSNGKSVLYNSAAPFFDIPNLCAVAVTCREGEENITLKKLGDLTSKGIKVFAVSGGKTRQQSVKNALEKLYSTVPDAELVSIHDGARPFVNEDMAMSCIADAHLFGGAAPCVPETDSLVKVDEQAGLLCGRQDRTGVYRIQTPQVFRFKEILEAHRVAEQHPERSYTDDTQIFTDNGGSVFAAVGDIRNIKITFPEDLGKEGFDAIESASEDAENSCNGNCSTCHGHCPGQVDGELDDGLRS